MLRRPNNSRRDKPPLEAPQARDAALRLLGRREHSARELKAKLRARGLEGEDADKIVGDLNEQGWQSDARYAELLVRSRIGQGYGRMRIEAEMRVAGIGDSEIREAIESAEVDWDELAHSVWSRRFSEPSNMAERQKQYRFMAARGFDGGQIARVLKGDPDED